MKTAYDDIQCPGPSSARPLAARFRRGLSLGFILPLAIAQLVPVAVRAGTPLPYRGPLRHQIEETFLVGPAADDGSHVTVSFEKLRLYRKFIRGKRKFLIEHLTSNDQILKGRSRSEASKRALARDRVIALDHILERLEALDHEVRPRQIFEIAADILAVEYATRDYTDRLGSLKIPVHVRNMLFDWSAPRYTRARGAAREAGNLVDPDTGLFYTNAELKALIEEGFDLSTLDPPDETPFWNPTQEISQVEIVESYLAANDPVHRGNTPVFPPPDDAVLYYDRAHMTQSKPKLDVYHLDPECLATKPKDKKSCRIYYKLKFGMEVHSDPAVNALLGSLGYNVDIGKHLKRVRLYLGKKSLDDVEADWTGYFDRQRLHTYVPLRSVIFEGEEGHGFDEQGEYIVFHETVAELKFRDNERIGFFPFIAGHAAEHREARGLFAFNVWIANADMKDEENNKVTLRMNEEGRYQLYLTQQDLGHSLGLILPEKVNAFPWDAVETSSFSRLFGAARGRIELNYFDLQTAGLQHTATYADIKWMTRRIAQLTRAQITEAISLGRFPEPVAALYVEKLINRRNQLVDSFGLSDEFEPLPVDRHLTTADGAVVDGVLVQDRTDASSIDFRTHWMPALGAIAGAAGEGLLSAASIGIGAVDTIDPGDIEISGNVALTPDILLQVSRRISLNPDPKGGFDQHIVQDTVGLGVRPRIGYIGHAEALIQRRVSIAYPVATRGEGLKMANSAVPLLMSGIAREEDLPAHYVLYREDRIGGGVRVTSKDTNVLLPLGIDASGTWMNAVRSIVDRRGDVTRIWVDDPKYFDREVRAYLKAVILEIPFFDANGANGNAPARLYDVAPDQLDAVDHRGRRILDRIVSHGDYSNLEKISSSPPKRFSSRFWIDQARLRLFFLNGISRFREEHLTFRHPDEDTDRWQYKLDRRRIWSWIFLDNGETFQARVSGYLGADVPLRGEPGKPLIVTRFYIDDLNTHSDELDRYYGLLASLEAGKSPLPEGFRARDWEVSGDRAGRWTRMLVSAEVQLHAEALDRMAELDPDRFWALLADRLDIGPAEFTRYRRELRRSPRVRARNIRTSTIGRRAYHPVQRSKQLLQHLASARRANSDEARIRALVRAVQSASRRMRGSYDTTVLATLLEAVGAGELASRNQVSVSTRITKAFEDENNMPEKRDIVGVLGEPSEHASVDFPLFPIDGLELYGALDWVDNLPGSGDEDEASQ